MNIKVGFPGAYPERTKLLFMFIFFSLITYFLVQGFNLNTLAGYLDDHWQFADLQVLREQPLQSLLHLHSQPPLLNGIVALLQFLPGSVYQNFLVLNAACAGAVAVFGYRMASHFLPEGFAFAAALVYLLSPVVLLNAGYPFYPCLTALGYAALLWSFFLSIRHGRHALVWLVGSMVYLSLLRSSFSILHAVFFLGFYLLLNRRLVNIRQALTATAVVLVLCLAVPVKNLVMYGFFSSSSWSPLNIAKGLSVELPLGYFPTPAEIRKNQPSLQCKKAYGAQDTADFKHNGYPNYNSCIFLEYAKQAKQLIGERGSFITYAKSKVRHSLKYFSPPDRYFLLANRAAIAPYADAFDRIVYLQVDLKPGKAVRLTMLLLLALSLYVYARSGDRMVGVCLVFVGVHFLSHVLTDGDEADRFVFDIEMLFIVLFCACAAYLLKARRSGHQAVAGS